MVGKKNLGYGRGEWLKKKLTSITAVCSFL
jgi:hypothetical protein